MSDFRVSEIANQAGVSVQSVYRVMKRLKGRLEGHVTKKNGVRVVDDEGATMILETIGQSPVKPCQTMPLSPGPDVGQQLEEMKRVMLDMATTFKQTMNDMAEKIDHLAQENHSLRHQVKMLAAPTPVDVKEVIAWSPPKLKDPMEGWYWYEKLWFRLFAPERCRREELV